MTGGAGDGVTALAASDGSTAAGRRRARWALLVVAVMVLAIVFWPSRPAGGQQNALREFFHRLELHGWPSWLGFGAVEFLANIVMFIPLGLLGMLAWTRIRPLSAVLGWMVLSGGVELVQWTLLSGRTGDWRDVLANGIGAAIGVYAAVRRSARSARRPTAG